MDYKEFTKKELTSILDIIQLCLKSRAEQDIIDIIARTKELVCADKGICCLGDASTGKLVKYINLDYSREWESIYVAEKLYRIDPVIRYNYELFRTQFWSEALERYSNPQNIDLMNRASDFGLKYGIASGVNGDGYKGSIISFSSDRNRFDTHHKNTLDILTPHIHQALVRSSEKPIDFSMLSLREKEVLKWMKEGKTNWEISMILNISERTVKFHVQNIERKLDAVNKAHAVAIAMDTGLVL